MNNVRFELVGAKELDKALAQLPRATSRTVLRKTLTKAAEPVLTMAQYLVPVDQGDLKRSLKIGTSLSSRQRKIAGRSGEVMVYVGASHPMGAHAHLVEFGTAKTPAQPFLRPAWDRQKGKALRIFQAEIWKEIVKAAESLAKKATKRTLSKSARQALS